MELEIARIEEKRKQLSEISGRKGDYKIIKKAMEINELSRKNGPAKQAIALSSQIDLAFVAICFGAFGFTIFGDLINSFALLPVFLVIVIIGFALYIDKKYRYYQITAYITLVNEYVKLVHHEVVISKKDRPPEERGIAIGIGQHIEAIGKYFDVNLLIYSVSGYARQALVICALVSLANMIAGAEMQRSSFLASALTGGVLAIYGMIEEHIKEKNRAGAYGLVTSIRTLAEEMIYDGKTKEKDPNGEGNTPESLGRSPEANGEFSKVVERAEA